MKAITRNLNINTFLLGISGFVPSTHPPMKLVKDLVHLLKWGDLLEDCDSL